MSRARTALPSLAVALVLLAGACGDSSQPQTITIGQLGTDVLPARILDLDVELEDLRERLASTDRPYLEATGLYSLREGERLQGTLQVSRFAEDANVDSERFRLSIVNQIGSTEPKAFRMGDRIVYLTASKRQSVAVFFGERSFGVLSTLETFEQSRALLREILELDL